MSTTVVVILVVAAVVIVALVAVLVMQQTRRRHLKEKFGPEYERAVQEKESPREAERELAEREKRHKELDIKPLSASARERYTQRWALIQEQFVDRPSGALTEADRVLGELMAERGYPTDGGYEQQAADLSVRHARTLDHYRAAHDTLTEHERSQASTEKLREAMVRYRTVFEDLLTDGADNGHRNNGHHDKSHHAGEQRR